MTTVMIPVLPGDCPFCEEPDLEYPHNHRYPFACPGCGSSYWTLHVEGNSTASMLAVLLPNVSTDLLEKLAVKLEEKRDLALFSPWVFLKNLDWLQDANDDFVTAYLEG